MYPTSVDAHFDEHALIPSGIPAGGDLGRPLYEALKDHAQLPLALQPVIEDGSEDEIKACVFRVLSYRACEVMLDDMRSELHEKGIKAMFQRRTWNYHQSAPRVAALKCMTVVEAHLTIDEPSPDAHDFLMKMADRYGYRYVRFSATRKAATCIGGFAYLEPSTEIEAQLVWPYWT